VVQEEHHKEQSRQDSSSSGDLIWMIKLYKRTKRTTLELYRFDVTHTTSLLGDTQARRSGWTYFIFRRHAATSAQLSKSTYKSGMGNSNPW
jgi:hypothetical protein